MRATAIAHPNIALVKYWGKRDDTAATLNLPGVGSISITLDTLVTRTSVRFDKTLAADEVWLGGQPAADAEAHRVRTFLDLVRAEAAKRAGSPGANAGNASDEAGNGRPRFARVETDNNFPTSAGLASSASGFAALAAAAAQAAGLTLSARELSILARRGSGSAARSVFGGFVEMHRGVSDDGRDAFAEPLAASDHWPLRVLVAITSEQRKTVGSTDGMQLTRITSPFYGSWVDAQPGDLTRARAAIKSRDFATLARVSERSCLKMHAVMLSADPALLYWNATTLGLMHTVRHLRAGGAEVFFTIDAGPQLKAVCTAASEAQVQAALRAVPGVRRVLRAGMGGGARIVEAAA